MGTYYLSCMAVSPLHGGGLTMQRVIPDLAIFDRFIHLHGFALSCPIIPALADRQWNLFRRAWVHRLAYRKIQPRLLSAARFRLTRMLHRVLPDYSVKKKMELIAYRLQPAGSRWLVVPQGPESILIANELKRRFDVTYVTWMMDDHVVNLQGGALYPSDFEDEMRFHLQSAHHVFVISRTMADLYLRLFGVESEVLFSPCEKALPPRYIPHGAKLRLAYFGALSGWQKDPLSALAEKLPRLDSELVVFSHANSYEELQGNPHVKWCAGLRPDQVASVIGKFDGVVIPASFRPEFRRMTRLNIPTKLSECLGSGSVPVVIAPGDSAIVDFLRDSDAAVLIESLDSESEFRKLEKLRDIGFRKHIIDNAQTLAAGHVSQAEMRRRWMEGVRGVFN
jgi:glycosyltransferase involved in cell wall biosynthesis